MTSMSRLVSCCWITELGRGQIEIPALAVGLDGVAAVLAETFGIGHRKL